MINIEYNFKWFNKELGNSSITIAEYGLVFNRAAIEELGKPEFILIGYDKDKSLIGIKPVKKGVDSLLESAAFPFTERERNGLVRINCKDFIKNILRSQPCLSFNPAQKLDTTWDEANGFMVVDLAALVDENSNMEGGENGTQLAVIER